MLEIDIPASKLYLGRNVGEQILSSIRSASVSIRVMSPYLSHDYVKLLLEKKNRGVTVSLLTSTEIEKPARFHSEIYRLIINQARHTDEAAKIRRRKGLIYSLAGMALAVAVPILGLYLGAKVLAWIAIALPLSYMLFRWFRRMRIYSYTYSTILKFSAILSPHTESNNNYYLAHAKIYIIDEKEAYLGSVNYTKSSFLYNYESCIKIIDPAAIAKITKEFDYLIENDETYYRYINIAGKYIYHEPVN